MPMPKGFKAEHGYATTKTFDGGEDYRTIAIKMSQDGYKMNHATARNVLLSAMRSLASDLLLSRGEDLQLERVDQIARSPQFQSGISDAVSDLYSSGELKVL